MSIKTRAWRYQTARDTYFDLTLEDGFYVCKHDNAHFSQLMFAKSYLKACNFRVFSVMSYINEPVR